MVAIPILVISAIIYSLALTFLIAGLAEHGEAFGLPPNNDAIQSILAIIFGLLAALILIGPLIIVAKDRKRKK